MLYFFLPATAWVCMMVVPRDNRAGCTVSLCFLFSFWVSKIEGVEAGGRGVFYMSDYMVFVIVLHVDVHALCRWLETGEGVAHAVHLTVSTTKHNLLAKHDGYQTVEPSNHCKSCYWYRFFK